MASQMTSRGFQMTPRFFPDADASQMSFACLQVPPRCLPDVPRCFPDDDDDNNYNDDVDDNRYQQHDMNITV